MGIGFFIAWIVTFTSAIALVICIRELSFLGLETWRARRMRTLDHWLSGRDFRLDDQDSGEVVLSDDRFSDLVHNLKAKPESGLHNDGMSRHFLIMLGLGFVAALGTAFGLMSLA